ncbi:hypothetical protein [Ensifer sp. LC163]|uniref:hypothetical protein n=1 Tax=Ensifer sp. LC163 TaxID=1120652 RepID=UPI00081382D8|nr:hypothetical protein [Ensifer sp. LC163]OCP35048.1 hypothetical protein BC360_28620 [Ensifer sp. LC163]
MNIHCFTSFSFSYLNRARVLAATIKKFHPDWVFWAVITDQAPDSFIFDRDMESFDRLLWGQDLRGEASEQWLFKHDIVEACTAVKGYAMKAILAAGAEKVIYLDPDIAVFSSLEDVVSSLDSHSIVLTPHQTQPETAEMAIRDNEITSLRLGVYNLGFLAIRNDKAGNEMANWWCDRLSTMCYDLPEEGVFVDQKWCDLIPALFDQVGILRDPGFNVASWNLSHRRVHVDQTGCILANESKLKFFHFTKLGPLGDVMTRRYAGPDSDVYELWMWYKNAVEDSTDRRIPERWWYYSTYRDGERIQKKDRVTYRQRKDLQAAFSDPFASGQGTFQSWLRSNAE